MEIRDYIPVGEGNRITAAQINSRIHKMIKAREGLKKAQRKMEENL